MTTCHAPNFPTVYLTRLIWLHLGNCDCQIHRDYASRAVRLIFVDEQTSILQISRSILEVNVSRSLAALFEVLYVCISFRDGPQGTSFPGLCLSLRAATTVMLSHEGFYGAVEPYSALRGSTIANDYPLLPTIRGLPSLWPCPYGRDQWLISVCSNPSTH